MVHYEETAVEIWDQCDQKIDFMFLGAGTCGTLTGISRRLKELNPKVTIVAIDLYGSVLSSPESLNADHPAPEGGQIVEGIGAEFYPRVFDRTQTDYWVKVPDNEALKMARRIMREEGMLCGGSSGSVLWGALKFIKEKKIGKDKRCVVLFADNVRNYITKHLSADWMYEKGYIDELECIAANIPPAEYGICNDWGQDLKVSDINLASSVFLDSMMTIQDLLALMTKSNTQAYVVCTSESS